MPIYGLISMDYEYMDFWEKFSETPLLPEKEYFFYSHLNVEDITNTDYVHTKIVCNDFEEHHEYHDWDFQSDMLLLADVKI